MLRTVFLAACFYFLFAPMLTLIHEFGHAVVPLLRGEEVQVSVGGFQGGSVKVGKLTIVYSSPLRPWIGRASWKGPDSFWSIALGPLASACTAALLLLVILTFRLQPMIISTLWAGVGWAFFQFLMTAIPMSYPEFTGYPTHMKNDGRKIFESIQGQKEKF